MSASFAVFTARRINLPIFVTAKDKEGFPRVKSNRIPCMNYLQII
jgi:hypothetical protein